ncbi:MAG: S1C family serine protease, partial [Bacteroidales bacterium]|nr:S1C family serine protease [Bacteroidales bacterium]
SATCTKEGLATYRCFACDSDYTETLPKTDHKYSKKTTAPTCTTGGYDTYTCSVCGYSYTANQTSALGHNYVNGSCTRCGAKDPNSGTGKELTTEEVYAKCSPAVFTIYTYDEYGYPIAQGSGFFVSSNGVAVTNAHVVEDAEGVKIILSDGRTLWADSLIGGDSAEDWAVLKVNVTGVPYLSIGSRSTAVGGTSIYTIGSPKGMNNTISTGIISNPNRLWNGVSYIQITAPISPGSSGGALINKYGQVIGITTAQFYPSSGNELYGAVPIQYAAATLRKYGVSCPD